MKKLVYTVFVAFWSSLATLLAVEALAPPVAAQPAAARAIDAAELARHAAPADCWMAIDGTAYDVTGYLPGHPSAPDIVTRWCGREASEAFATKGYGRPHSAAARRQLEALAIGPYAAPP